MRRHLQPLPCLDSYRPIGLHRHTIQLHIRHASGNSCQRILPKFQLRPQIGRLQQGSILRKLIVAYQGIGQQGGSPVHYP